jgi:hypothetical protein
MTVIASKFNILQRIEEKQGVFFIHLFSMATKTWSDEFIVYGSKNSILVDTINYTNEGFRLFKISVIFHLHTQSLHSKQQAF